MTSCDDFGFVPVLGTPADLGNAAGYTLEGNWGEALLSVFAVLPVGDAIKAGRKATHAAVDALQDISRLSKPSSRTLGRNLVEAGVERPTGAAAHHLVAGGAAKAAEARTVLEKFDIDINDASNGVFLPANRKSPNSLYAAVHSTVHTDAYYSTVNGLLAAAESREDALATLDFIRAGVMAGEWP